MRRFWNELLGSGYGFSDLVGDVVYYNYTSGTYDYKDLQNYKVLVHILPVPEGVVSLDPFVHIITEAKIGSSLTYEIHGLGASVINRGHSGGAFVPNYAYAALAYAVDRETGRIVYAPDFGQHGAQQFGFQSIYCPL